MKINHRRCIRALIIKEGFQIIRDPSSILIAFVLPMILLFLFGYGVSLDTNAIRVALVVEEKPDVPVRGLMDSFLNSRFFDVRLMTRSREAATAPLLSGEVHGIVVIPEYFSKYSHSRAIAPLQVITDGTDPNTAGFIANYVGGTWRQWLIIQGLETRQNPQPIINVESRFWYNEELKSRYFLVPSSMAIILSIIGTLLTALVVAREWERGTMEAMLATPIGILDIICGKLIPYFLLGLGSMVVCTLVALFLFSVPLRGSFLSLFVVSSLYLCSALGMGLLISTTTRNQFVASQIALLTSFLPTLLLSGFVFEINSMPIILQYLTLILPARYFVLTLKTIFLAGDIGHVLIPNMLAIAGLAAVLIGITALKTKHGLD